MKISVIIPSYNEKEFLENCIQSLGSQTYSDFEIVVVDDGSTDGTSQVLENLKNTLPEFKYFIQKHLGAGMARNLGVKNSFGKILLFVDADMIFEENFLEKLTEPIRNEASKGTFSKEEFVSNWDNVWARCWNINQGWEEKRRHPKNYPNTQPVFRAILKSEFEKVGGFDKGGYMDDWSLSKKLGYLATNAPGAVFYHKNPETLVEVFTHSKWVAKRKYKFGFLGDVYALVRSSFPISLVLGTYKAIINKEPLFLIFKVVYDLGIFFGILEFLIIGKESK